MVEETPVQEAEETLLRRLQFYQSLCCRLDPSEFEGRRRYLYSDMLSKMRKIKDAKNCVFLSMEQYGT